MAGYKFNFMDMQAALGIHQLPLLDSFNLRRSQLAQRYYEKLQGCPALILPKKPVYEHGHAWHLFAPLVAPEKAGLDRDQLMAALKTFNIGTGLHYVAIHLSPFYRERYGFKRGDLPHTEFISDRVLSLPLFPTMTENDQDRVLSALDKIFAQG